MWPSVLARVRRWASSGVTRSVITAVFWASPDELLSRVWPEARTTTFCKTVVVCCSPAPPGAPRPAASPPPAARFGPSRAAASPPLLARSSGRASCAPPRSRPPARAVSRPPPVGAQAQHRAPADANDDAASPPQPIRLTHQRTHHDRGSRGDTPNQKNPVNKPRPPTQSEQKGR